jgi:hypothetical protein
VVRLRAHAAFVVVEVVTAFVAGSLHCSPMPHTWPPTRWVSRWRSPRSSSPTALVATGCARFGLFRLEILAALVNAVLLFASATYVLVEAVLRLARDDIDVEAGPMLVVATIGLGVNVVVFLLLRDGARDNLAMESTYIDAMADAAGSVALIIAAVVIATVVGTDRPDRRDVDRDLDPSARLGNSGRARSACYYRSRLSTSISTRSAPSCARFRVSSTCTTCTSGRSRRRWRWPRRT